MQRLQGHWVDNVGMRRAASFGQPRKGPLSRDRAALFHTVSRRNRDALLIQRSQTADGRCCSVPHRPVTGSVLPRYRGAVAAAMLIAITVLHSTPRPASALPGPPSTEQSRDMSAIALAQMSPVNPSSPTTDSVGPTLKVTPTLHELSPWSMFMSADVIVKAVMVGLAFASLVTWTVLFAKTAELFLARRRLTLALEKIADAHSLCEARAAMGSDRNVLFVLLAAAMREARLSTGISSDAGIKERATSHFSEIIRAEARRIRLGMGLLATIGATSPFVGLFGTVWGIMNSFIGISKSQTTNLAVVAPGIAEALLATAIGLVAAIPAVIIYNHFARVTKGYLELVHRASGATGRLLSRDLDRGHGAVARAAE
jgi:biopolymer transport protein ExbB